MDINNVTVEDPRSPAAASLIAELSRELAALYPTYNNGDGSGAFKPEDVLVPRAAFVVLRDGNDAVGCGAIRPMDDPNIAEVKRMFVRPSARGKGHSRSILAALEQLARDYGYRALRLETGVYQTEAIRLYESSGFQRIDCYDQYANLPLSLCYEKTL